MSNKYFSLFLNTMTNGWATFYGNSCNLISWLIINVWANCTCAYCFISHSITRHFIIVLSKEFVKQTNLLMYTSDVFNKPSQLIINVYSRETVKITATECSYYYFLYVNFLIYHHLFTTKRDCIILNH